MRILRIALLSILLLAQTRGGAEEKDLRKIDSNMGAKAADAELKWVDADTLTIEGQGWKDTESPYDRLPAKARGQVPDAVWNLSRHSAGLAVRFVTDATKMAGRWTLTSENLAMAHMPATGVSGLDLYVRVDGQWRWAGVGKPEQGVTNEVSLIAGIPKEKREFLLYLPLYNGVKQLDIGIPPEATIEPAPPRPADSAKPVVIYGTSIVQGGCASRPGMAHTAILGRQLDRPVINLGFSGNGKMEMALAQLLGELDAAAYVLDCGPNMSEELVDECYLPFVRALRAERPDTPIILVESVFSQSALAFPDSRAKVDEKNARIHGAYETLVTEKMAKLSYVPCADLLGRDGQGTVDGVHPTDLGFMRMADALAPVILKALEEAGAAK